MQEKNVYALSLGCRLNSLESEKIKKIISSFLDTAIVINTCAVTYEAERKSVQKVRKIARENPNVPIFVSGCAVTRDKNLFSGIPNLIFIHNKDKLFKETYVNSYKNFENKIIENKIVKIKENKLSKQFIKIQNGCNHICSYCITRLLRGKNESSSYLEIMKDIREALDNGFYEIILTGIDIASYNHNGLKLHTLCEKILKDFKDIKRLRLSSIDPASNLIPFIIDLMSKDKRLMPHFHLSIQSGSDYILEKMRRIHRRKTILELNKYKNISFSCDIICGFPFETEDCFNETVDLMKKLKPIKIHAFPFSARPETEAFYMENKIDKTESQKRVKILNDLSDRFKMDFMKKQIFKRVSVLMENNNLGRTEHDIEIKIINKEIPNKTICDVNIIGIKNNIFIGKIEDII